MTYNNEKNSSKQILTLVAVLLLVTAPFISAHEENISDPDTRNNLYKVRISGELSDSQLDTLKTKGIEIVEYEGKGSYLLKAVDATAIDAVSFIGGSEKVRAHEKIHGSLKNSMVLSPASDKVRISIAVSDNVELADIKSMVSRHGGKLSSRKMMYGNRVLAEVPVNSLSRIAEYDAVRSIENSVRARITHNAKAAKASKVVRARNEFGLSGRGVAGGIWDEGAVDMHDDLVHAVSIAEKGKVSDHATHVAGTIAGSGANNSSARGMAPDTQLFSYNFAGKDIPGEMAKAVKNHGISFSNNSWSYANGWSYHYVLNLWLWWGDENFGRYSQESAAYDELVEKTDLVVLFAAGNDRGEKGTDEPYLDMTIGRGNTAPHAEDGPYRSLDVTASAKNVITVGAVDNKGKMTSFSSWGPTKDGRVKPEIVAVGDRVTSTVSGNEYATYSGTSMATPAASGGVSMLVEQYQAFNGKKPGAAIIRSLLAATGKDLGNKGPDYKFGFGLIDIYRAAALIEDDQKDNTIITDKVRKAKSNRIRRYRVNVEAGTSKMKVALAWIDPAAKPDAEFTLVNDLDLKVYKADGSEVHLPYILDGDNPSKVADHGQNTIDNIELVEIDSPDNGEWIVEVSLASIGKGKSQNFALTINSSKELAAPVEKF